MRADSIKEVLKCNNFSIIDTDIPTNKMCRLWKSIGFRYKIGPLISRVNEFIIDNLPAEKFDLIWVDKAIYITHKTTSLLKSKCNCLIHYTPDPAFECHQSRIFYESLPLYDYAITTKSFEISKYQQYLNKDQILFVTQGYCKKLHRPLNNFEDKKGVVFLGRYEKSRKHIIETLLKNNIPVILGGSHKWNRIAEKHKNDSNLTYINKSVTGEDYVNIISHGLMALGSICKWFAEKHTTRTFEIPACGTALLTERNDEIEEFYNDDEVIFYKSIDDLVMKIKYYLLHQSELKIISEKGRQRIEADGRDYLSIIQKIFSNINFNSTNNVSY